MTTPVFEVPFRRCARCRHECHAAFTTCPSCQASFDTEEQRGADAIVLSEHQRQLATSAEQSKALEAQRVAADAEANRAIKDLHLYEKEQALKERRLVHDVLDGEPLRHVFESRSDSHHLDLDHQNDDEYRDQHRYDGELAKVRAAREKLRREAEGPERPTPRPSNWVGNATLLAVAGAFTVFIAYLMRSRSVAVLGVGLLAAGIGWAIFSRR